MRAACLMVLLAAVMGCAEPKTSSKSRDRLPRVETTTPAAQSLEIEVNLTATVEPLYKIDLCSRVTGIVGEFYPPDLDIGDRVAAGAPMLRLDVPELEAQREQRKASVAQAKAAVEQAADNERVAAREITEAEFQLKRYTAEAKFRRLETKRVTDLAARGATQPERVEEAERQLEAAEAAFEAAQAAVETRKAKQRAAQAEIRTADSRATVAMADLKSTEELIALATVKAPAPAEQRLGGPASAPSRDRTADPFYYVVSRRLVDRGATVKDAAQPLLTLMHVDTVRVLIDIPERDVPFLEAIVREDKGKSSPTGRVVLRVPSLRDAPSRGEFRGRITRTSGVLDSGTRTMRAEVEFDNRNGELRPGMYGTTTLTLGARPNALVLPASAFIHREGSTQVLVVDPDPSNPSRGVVRVVPVQTAFDDGKRIQVTTGLTKTDRVIVRGNTPLSAGDHAVAVEWRSR